MEERELALEIAAVARENKAADTLLFDLEHQSPITDFVLICSGRSQGHTRGICDKIEERLKKWGIRPHTVEGYQEGSWILLDYHVVIAHIFHPETRRYYDLEGFLSRHKRVVLPIPETTAGWPGSSDDGASGAFDERATEDDAAPA